MYLFFFFALDEIQFVGVAELKILLWVEVELLEVERSLTRREARTEFDCQRIRVSNIDKLGIFFNPLLFR